MNDLKLLVTMPSDIEAEIIKQKLSEAGIQSHIQSSDMDNMLPALDYTKGVSVFVEPDDFETAQGLIGSGEDDLEDDMEIGVGD